MIKAGKFISAVGMAVAAVAVIGAFSGHATFASQGNPSLAFSPRCVSDTEGVALFEVQNNESDAVALSFSDAAGSGSQQLASGDNDVFVPYQAGMVPDITFTYGTDSVDKTQVQVNDQCTSDQVANIPTTLCVDVTNASNLSVTWTGDSHITIVTKNGRPACQTVTLYYSTYHMPDNYDGTGFFGANGGVNPTAVPQTESASTSFQIIAGNQGVLLKNVPAPDYCYNTQADVYYGPEVTGIGNDGYGYHADGSKVASGYGHGTQNVKSQVFAKNAAQCVTTVPGMGSGTGTTTGTTATTPAAGSGAGTTAAPTVVTTGVPTVLPFTGAADASQNLLSTLLSLVFGAASLLAVGIRTLRA